MLSVDVIDNYKHDKKCTSTRSTLGFCKLQVPGYQLLSACTLHLKSFGLYYFTLFRVANFELITSSSFFFFRRGKFCNMNHNNSVKLGFAAATFEVYKRTAVFERVDCSSFFVEFIVRDILTMQFVLQIKSVTYFKLLKVSTAVLFL